MNKSHQVTWMLHGGIIGAAVFSVLALVGLAGAKYFMPQSVHISWSESPILLFLTVPSGFMLGGWLGYDIALKTKQERVEIFKEGLFYLIIVGACHLILHKIWDKPEAQDYFWASAAWDLGPILLTAFLWKSLRHKKQRLKTEKLPQ